MKKINTLITLIIIVSSVNVYSQTLPNTTWTVYNASSTFFAYFHFGTDTISYSIDNISYNNVSTFQVSSSNVSIIDLPGAPCSASDTGKYTFLIQNDTLKFTTVIDLCSSRVTTLSTSNWIRLQTGIQNINLMSAIKFYPNPFSTQTTIQTNNIFNNATFTIDNYFGQTVKKMENISGKTVVLSRDNLPSGLYFIRLTQENKVIMTTKLVITD